MKEEMKHILEAEANAILNIPIDEKIMEAIDLIYDTVHGKGGKLVASGMGKV